MRPIKLYLGLRCPFRSVANALWQVLFDRQISSFQLWPTVAVNFNGKTFGRFHGATRILSSFTCFVYSIDPVDAFVGVIENAFLL